MNQILSDQESGAYSVSSKQSSFLSKVLLKKSNFITSNSRVKFLKTSLLLIGCFVFSFGGAWAYMYTSDNLMTKTITKQSREVVLQEGEVVSEVAKSVSLSVVSVLTTGQIQQGYFFGSNQTEQGAGTGIIISKDGYVITNKHVVPDNTEEVSIVKSDGTRYDHVEVVGRDPLNDLAFLKIPNVNNLQEATLGDSSKVIVGQKVIAIGNALGQYQNSVTSGIISGLGRPVTAGDGGSMSSQTEELTNLLQTDAAINPGNSGGPLVNLKGEIVGINVAVAQDAQGVGFAIPINDAKGLIKNILSLGKVQRAYLGVHYISLTPDIATQLKLSVQKGAYIGSQTDNSGVISGGPADKAGIKNGDIITKVNGVEINQNTSLSSLVSQYNVGDTITLTILRNNKSQDIKVTLELYQG
jgi:serine protease Do